MSPAGRPRCAHGDAPARGGAAPSALPATHTHAQEDTRAHSVLLQVLQRPGTSGVAAVLIAIYLFITARGISYGDAGLSYTHCVERGELFRMWTAQLSHIDLLHLLFNLSALWSVSTAELGPGGPLGYLCTSAVLLALSGAVRASILVCSIPC